MIAGLRYVADYVAPEEAALLLTAVDGQSWQSTIDHRVQVHGYNYSHARREAFRIGDLPPWSRDLAERLCRDGLLPQLPNQLVANDYPPGAGMFAHVDQAVFGDVIASVSLGGSCVMRFVHADSEREEEIFLEPRSVLLLSGEARWDWRHEIPARKEDFHDDLLRPRSRRVSLTFRVVPT